MDLIITLALAICSVIGFAYGVYKLFKPKVALFKQLVVCSVGCMMLGRIYNLIYEIVELDLSPVFNVGMLASIGGFLFLFSASFGQMDGLVDNRSKELTKYRVISFAAPLVVMAAYAYLFFKLDLMFEKVFFAFVFVIIAMSSYYSLKHIIIPDVEYGIIDSIRSYSVVALIMAAFYVENIVASKLDLEVLKITSCIGLCILYLAIIPIMERGSKKWTI